MRRCSILWLVTAFSFLLWPVPVLADETVSTGPTTEQRFPPLKVPEGFKATLFACDPLIEYPSVIALGPAAGSLFVAHDYVTGLGIEIVRRDEIRLVVDSDRDGYADESTVFAKGFNSIQGLTYHDGAVFAMHSPQLTVLRDVDGDGIADERRDLFDGLGLAPEDNRSRLHCGNGIIVGHDGWLYLALGDNGCDVKRPEGDRLLFQQGGILRCRTDGADLHVFASGLRNIYDVALDDELNVFVRDNENDGGDYKIRIYHSVFGADHGYPYLYYERPEEAMKPLADLGLGAAAGGVCYLENAFPAHYQGLFFCEWVRSVMHFPRARSGSSFAAGGEFEFAAGAEDDPYGFKPTDAVVDRDGSLLVSDWADGQRPKRGRGRIYRIEYVSNAARQADVDLLSPPGTQPLPELIQRLDSPGYHARLAAHLAIQHQGNIGVQALRRALAGGQLGQHARLHVVWLVARVAGIESLDELFKIAETDASPAVRAQAVRAIADRTDPVLVQHQLSAGQGDVDVAKRLARLAGQEDPRVVLECVLAFGRLGWSGAPEWLAQHLRSPDAALAHAAMQTLRRCSHWPAVIQLLDLHRDEPLRDIASRAVTRQYSVGLVDGLVQRLSSASGNSRAEIADILARVYKKPAPWKYWGYRPSPRSANTVSWERSQAIEQALDGVLRNADYEIKTATLQRMLREEVPVRLTTIAAWLADDRDVQRVAALLTALESQSGTDARPLLAGVIRAIDHSEANRMKALEQFTGGLSDTDGELLYRLASDLEDGPVLAAGLDRLARHPDAAGAELLLHKLDSTVAAVRAAAISSLGQLGSAAARQHVKNLLVDPAVEVRIAAASVAGKLDARHATDRLLGAAADPNPQLCSAALESLRLLGETRAIPAALSALEDSATQLAALALLGELGSPTHFADVVKVAGANRSIDVLHESVRVLSDWQSRAEDEQRSEIDRAIAQLQGDSGSILRWVTTGPLAPELATERISDVSAPEANVIGSQNWQVQLGQGTDARTRVASEVKGDDPHVWLAVSDVLSELRQDVDVLASSTGTSQIWLNGQQVHERSKPDGYRSDSDQFVARLAAGRNRFVVRLSGSKTPELHLRFLPKSSSAEDAVYIQHALKTRGSSKRGQEVFLNVEKSRCLKCHQLGDKGARIGPDLTSVGSRFSRIHLIESILEPSRTIAPSYQTFSIVQTNGLVLTGVLIAQDSRSITVGDNQGKNHTLPRTEIDEMIEQTASTMPERLEKELTRQEFADLIAFLLSQQKTK